MASRGTLGLEVIVNKDTGATGRSSPFSGISTDQYDAKFVIDSGILATQRVHFNFGAETG